MKNQKKNTNDAVSPVVGVMLMLVVTIVIASVVAAFASGLGGTVQSAPTATFQFTLHASGGSSSNANQWQQPGVSCSIPVSTGDFSSNDLKIITSYTVPQTYNGTPLSDAGKTITTTTTGRVQDYGIDLDNLGTVNALPNTINGVPGPYYNAANNPFEAPVYLYQMNIIPTGGNGLTVGPEQNQAKFFGGDLQVGSGTTWWFKNIDAFLGFPVKERATYGFTEGSTVHITVVHIPTGTALFDEDVKAVW